MATEEGTYLIKSAHTWIQPDGPLTPFKFLKCMGVGDITKPEGDLTPRYCKDPDAYGGGYKIRGMVQGEPALGTVSLDAYLEKVSNYLLSLRCSFDLAVLIGPCGVAASPNGWEKIIFLHNVRISSRTISGPSRTAPGENDFIMNSADTSFEEQIEINRITANQLEIGETDDVTAIFFFNEEQCAGPCGPARASCAKGFVGTDAQYLLPASVWYTVDFGLTWTQTDADPFEGSEGVSDIVGIYPRIIVGRGTANLNKPAEIAYSEDDGNTWTSVYLDGVNNGTVNALWWLTWERLWACGNGGRIWFSYDGGGNWTQQTTGLTNENLNDIHVNGDLFGVSPGNNNALLLTSNGTNWSLGSGPAAAIDALTTGHRCDENTIWVGSDNGNLYYTRDGGTIWTAATFAGAGTGVVEKVWFNPNIPDLGVMMHTIAGTSRIFRTWDGGLNWVLDPGHNTPTNNGLNDFHVCPSFNDIYAAGDVMGLSPMILKYESQL